MTDVRLLLVVLCVLTVTAAASAAEPTPIRATMSTSSTMPLADVPWRFTVVVQSRAGKPLGAKMRLQVLRGTTVIRCLKRTAFVACSGENAGAWISFTGKKTGVVRWPAKPAGVKLTFQAVVVAGTRSLRLRAPVTVSVP